MKLKLQNIGGITQPISIELKEGLNVIRAPNAIGKTSFTHGLKITSMDNNELKDHPEFINDFANEAIVTVDNKSRKIKRQGNFPLSKDTPIFRLNGRSGIIFANPDNEFLNTVVSGKPIDEFIESFSDSQYYKKLIQKGGAIDEAKKEINEEYGIINSEVKQANELKKNINKFQGELSKKIKERDVEKKKVSSYKLDSKIDKEKNIIEHKGNELQRDISKAEREINNITKKDIPEYESQIRIKQKIMEVFLKKHPNIESEIKSLEDKQEKLTDMLDELYKNDKINNTAIESCEDNIDEESQLCLSCGKKMTGAEKERRLIGLNKLKKEINKKIDDANDTLEKLSEEIDTLIDDRTEKCDSIKKEIAEINNQLRKVLDEKRSYEASLPRNKNEVEKLQEKLKKLEENYPQKIRDIFEEVRKIEVDINVYTDKIEDFNDEFNKLSGSEKTANKLQEQYNFLKRVEGIIETEIVNLKNAVRNSFNKRITNVYNKLGFKDFRKIEIDSTFRIIVTRKNKIQELNRLSTSERVTLGVIVMLVGKEEYLPEYPFFVLDEVTTAYDPIRFKKIIDYITDETKTNYTIVTAFSPTGDKIKVEHKL